MKNKSVVILIVAAIAFIGVIALTLLLLSEQQDTRSRANTPQEQNLPTPQLSPGQVSQNECPVLGGVPNVLVEFPNCIGETCNQMEANCSWNSVAGASEYELLITEEETESAVREERVLGSITKAEFAINTGHSYKCEVAAVNSCGVAGIASSHTLYIQAAEEVAQPTPIPTSIPLSACGSECSTTSDCQAGLTCVNTSSEQGYCSIPSYQAACIEAPSVAACCTAQAVQSQPTLQPTQIQPTQTALVSTMPIVTNTPASQLPPAGVIDNAIVIIGGITLLLLAGVALFVL